MPNTPSLEELARTMLLTASEVRTMILDEVADWGSQKAVAARMGVSPAYLSDVLLQRREPGPKIADYFELEPVTLFRAHATGEAK